MQNLDLKNKTVFITGVAGFIGSNLAERLLKEIEGISFGLHWEHQDRKFFAINYQVDLMRYGWQLEVRLM